MSKTLAETYLKQTDIEHVLSAPDMYIGPIQKTDTLNWMFVDGKMVQKSHEFIPALYKLFDEIVVNAADQSKRMEATETPVTYISCTIEKGTIKITNDGPGIDVDIHPTYQVYIPQLIFSELRTSTNYDKSEKKIVGGKNGYGAKLAVIWSTLVTIETVDAVRKLKYTQTFQDNLGKINKPTIVPYKKKSYTSFEFTPDYKRFGLDGLDADTIAVFEKRMMDIAAITNKKVKVSFNGKVLECQTFQKYVDFYIEDAPRAFETCDRWDVCASFTKEPGQVSFVNSIYTQKGGKHVDYIMNQILRKLTAYIHQKKKIDVRPSVLKDRMFLFIICYVENPTFDSQTKDYLSTPSSAFGSTCEISDKFIKKLADMGFMEIAVAMTQKREMDVAKKNDGAKTRTIQGIPKLIDANFAGTMKSKDCTLILTEGDSATASVVSGLSKKDRDTIGVFPLRGKLLNTRGENITRINENKEIHELKQIIGLEIGKVYTQEDVHKKLRYGKVLIITDQDKDGSHIKGLCINLFGSMWKSLLEQSGFIGFMNTPIIKARKGTKELQFYHEGQFDEWKSANNSNGWDIKYYKGLGTSTAKEFTQYFSEREKHIVQFKWTPECEDSIDKVFNKARADDRKRWLESHQKSKYIDTSKRLISYTTFIDEELIQFSNYDCIRSIPNVMDGFKPSQRKILYAAFKRGLDKEIKVAQFSGYVSEHTAYHHGEASLNGAIVNMAQDYVGSNNIELLKPNGQFGTRLNGGKDSASERYIFTQLQKYTRLIFPPEDDAILDYVYDDGHKVEPLYYVPIIPMVLVNGCKGIGTGTSTNVLCYHPKQLIDYLIKRLQGSDEKADFVPYYRGFRGVIEPKADKFTVKGVYTQNELTVHITELPIGTWTNEYKEFLESIRGTILKEYIDNSTDVEVNLTLKLLQPVADIEKTLKLSVMLNTNNMNLFNADEQLRKYTIPMILDEFYGIRLCLYEKRKAYQLKQLNDTLRKITNKVMYIRSILEDKLDLRRKKLDEIVQALKTLKIEEHEGSYHYLIKMPMDSVTEEKVTELEKEHDMLQKEIQELTKTSIQTLWERELNVLKKYI